MGEHKRSGQPAAKKTWGFWQSLGVVLLILLAMIPFIWWKTIKMPPAGQGISMTECVGKGGRIEYHALEPDRCVK
jgi:hypothetical protein